LPSRLDQVYRNPIYPESAFRARIAREGSDV